MLRSYLLLLDPATGTRDAMVRFIDTRPEVPNWFAFHPNAIVLVSADSAHRLSDIIRGQFPGLHFLVTLIPPGENNGWQTEKVWAFINDPKKA